MFLAELVCSEESCEFTIEAVGEFLELEALLCDCGCCLQIVTISEAEAIELSRPLEVLRAA